MNPSDFSPEIWTSEQWPHPILVCGRRWFRGQEVLGSTVEAPQNATSASKTCSMMGHPVAIQLSDPPLVFYGFKSNSETVDEVWERHRPEHLGMPSSAASLALAEAWRCVDITHSQRDFSAKVSVQEEKLANFRNGAIRRNILVWLSWGRWKAEGATLEQRRKDIEAKGFTITKKAFERLLENAGMSI